MEQNISKNGLVNLFALLLGGLAAALTTLYAGTATGQLGVLFTAMGFLVATASWAQMRLIAREAQEKLEFDELQKSRSSAALFSGEGGTFRAQVARKTFERWVVPGFTLGLFLLQGFAVWWLWRWLNRATAAQPERSTMAMACSACARPCSSCSASMRRVSRGTKTTGCFGRRRVSCCWAH